MDYNPNSNNFINKEKTKEEHTKKRVEKVVSGNVKTKKRNEVLKLADIFTSEDVSTVKSHIFSDVLVPSIKKMVSDAVKTGIDMILYGDSDVSRTKSPASKVSYSKFYNEPSYKAVYDGYSKRETYEYNNIVLETRGDAEAVLMALEDMIDQYDIASVADLYDLVGIVGSYTDNKYGWTSVRSARIERVRDGYVIRMPKALPLD